MRRKLLLRVVTVGAMMAVAAGNTGCSTMNNTEKGVGLGGAIGAGAGALIGSASGNPKTGAVIGGLLGAGAGGVIGNDVDRKDARDASIRQDRANQAYAYAQPERLAEVVAMAKGGQSEVVMLNHIRTHGMQFNLSIADLGYLKSNGVSDRVIAEMQTGGSPPLTRGAAPRTVVVREEVPVIVREQVIVPAYGRHYHPRPVYIAPPPPAVVGATFNFR